MTDTITGAIIGVGGTIVGVLLAGPITYWFSRRLVRKAHANALDIMQEEAFHVAAAKLRAAFAPAQVRLFHQQEMGNELVKKFFDETFLLHAAAIEEFRPFVSDGWGYQEAWEDYRKTLYGNDLIGDANLRWTSGMCINESGDECLDFLHVIQQKINQILHFTSVRSHTSYISQ